MKDEIKEILECLKQLTDFKTLVDNGEVKQIFADFFNPHLKIDIKNANILLDYITNLQEELEEQKRIEQASLDTITNLQEENKEWSMMFDTFSKRPYAHKYLEEKKKELGNKKIIGLDSEMIYKDYYDYKSRIDKAIEYINKHKQISEYHLEEVLSENSINSLLNILGGDK